MMDTMACLYLEHRSSNLCLLLPEQPKEKRYDIPVRHEIKEVNDEPDKIPSGRLA